MSNALLRQLINEYFDEGELREICFDLDVAYEDLGGQGKRQSVIALITYLERRDRLSELIEIVQQLRPSIAWPTVADDIGIPLSEEPEPASAAVKSPELIRNPFTYGNPISDPKRFFGRNREVDQVFSRLSNPEHESSSLVGGRRIGKTSLLKYIAHPEVRRRKGLDPEQFIFIYIDLQMLEPSTTPNLLWKRLITRMAPHCRDREVQFLIKELLEGDEIDNFALADLFDAIDATKQYLVLLLDEFENVTNNENFDVSFFYGLRSLAIQHNLSLVTSSSQTLIELTHSEAIRSSPFFNIFANIDVGLFSDAEARRLIHSYLSETNIRFSSADIETILRVAGTYPFFLQAACHFLYRAYSNGLTPDERNAYVTSHFRLEAAPHLDHYWKASSNHEQIVLLILALLDKSEQNRLASVSDHDIKNLYSRSEQTLTTLERRGLITSFDHCCALFNTTFTQWVIDEITDLSDDNLEGNAIQLSFDDDRARRLSDSVLQPLKQLLPLVAFRYHKLILTWLVNCRDTERAIDLLSQALT